MKTKHLGILLKPEHLNRYKDIARFLWKYGRSGVVSGAGLDEVLTETDRNSVIATPEEEKLALEFVEDLEKLGPIYIKLGQVLSSRPDLLPPVYIQALTRLQNKLKPFSFQEVEEIIKSELGVRLSKAFSSFDEKPIGVASLGQVHKATLRDGRTVAVKIQRPGIRQQIADDLEVLEEITAFADAHTEVGQRFKFADILEEFRKNLLLELDYRQEVRNLMALKESLREFPLIVIPSPIPDYSSARVLVMEFVHGKTIKDVSAFARLEMDGQALAEELSRAYLKQILIDGMFHADPHPGNVFITEDHRIALIDLGMVGHLTQPMQDSLLKLLLSVSEGRADEAASIAIKIGDTGPDFNEPHFRRKVADLVTNNLGASIKDIQIGKQLMAFSQVTGSNDIRMPPELTLFSKTLLNLDDIERMLCPDFDPNASIRRDAANIMQKRILKTLTPANLFYATMESQEIIAEMPGRVNKILDIIAKNQIKIQVDAVDETTLIEGFQKVANRIATGLILAALIIGAAMLMRVDTNFRLFGYPGLAMICFLIATGGGLSLIVIIILNDQNAKKKSKK